MSLYHIAFITHLFEKVGIDLLLPPFLAGSLGFILVLVFLLVPVSKKQACGVFPWYDAAFACASAGICLYVLLMGQKMAEKAVLPALGSLDLILGSADTAGLPVRATAYGSDALTGVLELYARTAAQVGH